MTSPKVAAAIMLVCIVGGIGIGGIGAFSHDHHFGAMFIGAFIGLVGGLVVGSLVWTVVWLIGALVAEIFSKSDD